MRWARVAVRMGEMRRPVGPCFCCWMWRERTRWRWKRNCFPCQTHHRRAVVVVAVAVATSCFPTGEENQSNEIMTPFKKVEEKLWHHKKELKKIYDVIQINQWNMIMTWLIPPGGRKSTSEWLEHVHLCYTQGQYVAKFWSFLTVFKQFSNSII